MDTDRIEREVTIEAPPARVWSLLTEAEHLGTWFADAGAEIELAPGGSLELHWEEHGTSRASIERVEPERHFSFRWAPFKDPGGSKPVAGNSTLVEFTLEPEGEGTRVRVVESGFSTLDTSEEQRSRNLEGNTEGWEHELAELADHAALLAA